MSDETLSPEIMARHPELKQIGEVLDALREGRPITTRCATCGEPLKVAEEQRSVLIRCPNNCTYFHAQRDKR